LSKVDGILFTHEHADHTSGFDIRRLILNGEIPIYASSGD
jgi:phosphoribosyl 1,2-cyclic phosphodiesterase